MKWIVVLALVGGCSLETSALAGPPADASTDVGADTRIVIGVDTGPDARRDSRLDATVDSWADGRADADLVDIGPDSMVAPTPTWTVVETMTIDTASSTPTTSSTVLAAGVEYRLRASGTVTNVIGSFQGDADYYDFSDPKDNGCCEDIGLGIDDYVVDDLDTQPDWGPYDPSHVYEVTWTGDGTTIDALFQDTYYGNNIGNLTLEILELR